MCNINTSNYGWTICVSYKTKAENHIREELVQCKVEWTARSQPRSRLRLQFHVGASSRRYYYGRKCNAISTNLKSVKAWTSQTCQQHELITFRLHQQLCTATSRNPWYLSIWNIEIHLPLAKSEENKCSRSIENYKKSVFFMWSVISLSKQTLSSTQNSGNTIFGIVFIHSMFDIGFISKLNCKRLANVNGVPVNWQNDTITQN